MAPRELKQPYVRVVEQPSDGDCPIQIWVDQCEGFTTNDLLIGAGQTMAEALQDARESLATAAKQLEHLENRG